MNKAQFAAKISLTGSRAAKRRLTTQPSRLGTFAIAPDIPLFLPHIYQTTNVGRRTELNKNASIKLKTLLSIYPIHFIWDKRSLTKKRVGDQKLASVSSI